MRVQPRNVEGFVRKPDAGIRCVLIYGPDQTLVSELARTLTTSLGIPPGDPFRTDEFSADQIAADKALLADAAAAQSLDQGSRLVRITDAGDRITPVIEDFLDSLPGAAMVVLEAKDLSRKRSSLVKLMEGANAGAALACYEDTDQDRETVFAEMFRSAGVQVDNDVVDWLAATLDANRGISRREIEKLCLLVGPGERLTMDLVLSAVAESGGAALDSLVFSALGGDVVKLEKWLERAALEDLSPVAMVRTLIGQLFKLMELHMATKGGLGIDAAIKGQRPPVFFKNVEPLKRQYRLWPEKAIKDQLTALAGLEAELKTTGSPDRLLCERHFYQIAILARRRSQAR